MVKEFVPDELGHILSTVVKLQKYVGMFIVEICVIVPIVHKNASSPMFETGAFVCSLPTT